MQKYVRPKKHLGQHFLKDFGIAKKIAETIQIDKSTEVLEIGPGTGMLTQFLLANKLIRLKVVELDKESISFLEKNYSDLEIIEADFLKLNLQELFKNEFYIIGNFPYNISSQIFFKLLDNKEQVPFLSGMVQKEVAERICASPGSKTYGILSVLLQAYYHTEYLFTVSEKVFNPPPKVKSAVIRLRRNQTKQLNCNEQLFKIIIKTTFNQRRKTLRNSIKPILKPSFKEELQHPILGYRPEQLSVQSFVDLTNLVEAYYIKTNEEG